MAQANPVRMADVPIVVERLLKVSRHNESGFCCYGFPIKFKYNINVNVNVETIRNQIAELNYWSKIDGVQPDAE